MRNQVSSPELVSGALCNTPLEIGCEAEGVVVDLCSQLGPGAFLVTVPYPKHERPGIAPGPSVFQAMESGGGCHIKDQVPFTKPNLDQIEEIAS